MRFQRHIIERIQAELLSLHCDWLNSTGLNFADARDKYGSEIDDLRWLSKNPKKFVAYFQAALADEDFEKTIMTAWKVKRLALLVHERQK